MNYDGFCELGQGKWEGLPKNGAYKDDLKNWEHKSAFEKIAYPKVTTGESYKEVATRFRRDLDAIIQKHQGKMIFIVSHYTAINALAIDVNQPSLSNEPGSSLPVISLENCDMVQAKVAADGSLIRVTAHIKAMEN